MPCAGPNTLLTQAFAPPIVELVHTSVFQVIASANKRADIKASATAALAGLRCNGRLTLVVGIEKMEELVVLSALPSLPLELKRCCAVAPQPAFSTVSGLAVYEG